MTDWQRQAEFFEEEAGEAKEWLRDAVGRLEWALDHAADYRIPVDDERDFIRRYRERYPHG